MGGENICCSGPGRTVACWLQERPFTSQPLPYITNQCVMEGLEDRLTIYQVILKSTVCERKWRIVHVLIALLLPLCEMDCTKLDLFLPVTACELISSSSCFYDVISPAVKDCMDEITNQPLNTTVFLSLVWVVLNLALYCWSNCSNSVLCIVINHREVFFFQFKWQFYPLTKSLLLPRPKPSQDSRNPTLK